MLLPSSSGSLARRFVTESKITAKLPHPGIPPVFALGELGAGQPFLAVKEGWRYPDYAKTDPDLASLGNREDFCELFGSSPR